MKDCTDVTVVLDRSGSMTSIADDTIGGFNTFIENLMKEGLDIRVSLVQFDGEYEPVFAGVPVGEVKPLDRTTFVPRGATALLDALGRTVSATGNRFHALPEEERPARVLFVIITDGQENASMEFTRERIREMIEHQQEKYSWDFIYLGANQDSFAEGGSIGIVSAHCMDYAAVPGQARDMYSGELSAVVTSYAHGNTNISLDSGGKT